MVLMIITKIIVFHKDMKVTAVCVVIFIEMFILDIFTNIF